MPPSFANPPAGACLTGRSVSVCRISASPIDDRRILDAPGALALWHLLSLDAPTVAAVWAMGFAWAAQVILPVWVPMLIALTAWSVYIGDRLLDARSGVGSGAGSAQMSRLRQRHFFHWQHRRVLAPVAVVSAAAASCVVAIFMPPAALARNTTLAGLALIYFSGVHGNLGSHGRIAWNSAATRVLARFDFKGFLVGLIFTATCVLPVLSRDAAQWPMVLPAAFFVLLAWLNCHAIESWESGGTRTNVFAAGGLLAIAGVFLAALLAVNHPGPAVLLIAGAASALLLALLDRGRGRFTPLALRAAADLVLLSPAFLFPLSLMVPHAR